MRRLDDITLTPADRPSVRTATDADMRAAEQMALWIASSASQRAKPSRWKFWKKNPDQLAFPLELPEMKSDRRIPGKTPAVEKTPEPVAKPPVRTDIIVAEPPAKRAVTPYRPPSRPRRPIWKQCLPFGLALLVGAGGVWELKTRTMTGLIADATTGSETFGLAAGLTVKEIMVSGRVYTKSEDLLATLGTRWGDSIFTLNLAEAKERLETLPWIKQASLERKLSGIIHVNVVERTPLAIWQHEGHFTLIDTEGVAIDAFPDTLYGLPLVVGANANRHAYDLISVLVSEPELMERIKAAVWVSDRRWNLIFDDIDQGLNVRLPEEGPQEAVRRLAAMSREQEILDRSLTMIDLRLPDRMILGTTPQVMPQIKPPRKDRDA